MEEFKRESGPLRAQTQDQSLQQTHHDENCGEESTLAQNKQRTLTNTTWGASGSLKSPQAEETEVLKLTRDEPQVEEKNLEVLQVKVLGK